MGSTEHEKPVLSVVRSRPPSEVDTRPRSVTRYQAGATIDCEQRPRSVTVLSGWVCEMRILHDGRRQIFGFVLPGDTLEIRPSRSLDTSAPVALTRLELMETAQQSGAEDARRRKEAWLYDHVVRLGRLTAKERMLHLLLEFYDRLDAAGLVTAGSYRLPLTQEVFADYLGLSVVHINRTIQQLRADGSLVLRSGSVTLANRNRLAAKACYELQAGSEIGRRA